MTICAAQAALEAHFKDKSKKEQFEMIVDLNDPHTIEINEINIFFEDDTSLHDKVGLLCSMRVLVLFPCSPLHLIFCSCLAQTTNKSDSN